MKIINNIDFTKTLNLPIKTIDLGVGIEKKEEYLLKKVQDTIKYKQVFDRNLNSGGKRYKIFEIPIDIEDNIDTTVLINKIYKDIFVRYQTMLGNIVDHKVMFVSTSESQNLKLLETIEEKNENDKKKVNKKKDSKNTQSLIRLRESNNLKLDNEVKKQIQEINNLGTIIDYSKNSLTEFESEFRDKMLDTFLMLYKSKKIYKELRPIHWCIDCGKSINKKDISYEKQKSEYNYVLYKVDNDNDLFAKYKNLENTYFIVTTVNTWQMISSNYISIAKDVEYCLVEVVEHEKKHHYIISTDEVDKMMELKFFVKYEKKEDLKNEDLKKIICINPIISNKKAYILETNKKNIFLTKNKGSGIFVISSGNNYLDYMILKSEDKLEELVNIIDVNGNIAVTSDLTYANVNYNDAKNIILTKLEELDLLYSKEKINVKVSKCNKCKNTLIYRLASHWYINKSDKQDNIKSHLDHLNLLSEKMHANNKYKKKEYLAVIERINKIKEVVISDERVVGTPVPTFYCGSCGKEVLNELSISVIKKLLNSKGIEKWHEMTPEEILQGQISCECGCGFFFKDDTTLNDFFGVISTVLVHDDIKEEEKISKVSIESKETFFEKLLAISFSNNIENELDIIDKIMVHSSLSKIKNTNIDFNGIIKKYGTDILRLWSVSNINKNIINLNEQSIIKSKFDYMAIRRVFKFILSNLSGFNPLKDNIDLLKRNDLDKAMYKNLNEFNLSVNENYENLEFDKAYEKIISFCKKDLCSDYFESNKYNLYLLNENDIKRKSVQSTFYDILMTLVIHVEPLIPFTIEEIWPFIWHKNNIEASNLLMYEYKKIDIVEQFQDEVKKSQTIYYIRDRITKRINNAKKDGVVKNNIEVKVIINTKEKQKEFIEQNYDELVHSLGVSLIEVNLTEKASIKIEKAPGTKCQRCKEISVNIGMDLKYRYLCPNCAKTLHELDK